MKLCDTEPDVLQAHTPNKQGAWHSLLRHSLDVASQAKHYAAAYPEAGAKIAYVAGLWHDLGKAQPGFQSYLRACCRGEKHPMCPHAIWGAVLRYMNAQRDQLEGAERLFTWADLAVPIAAHHSRLKNPSLIQGELKERLQPEQLKWVNRAMREMPELFSFSMLPQSPYLGKSEPGSKTRRELLVRMILSALVDADFLDTEKHFNPEKAAKRGRYACVDTLRAKLREAQQTLIDGLTSEETAKPVNRVRREVYDECLKTAKAEPGFFRLTVPTGGGKTRSGLAFALEHAHAHNLDRVVFAIPYTSIINQTIRVYRRDVFGEDDKEGPLSQSVLEHHSRVPIPGEQERQEERYVQRRLAIENWDAPIIVTTTVQLFESLFSDRAGRVRKLHRLARSVIVLDEVQTLPPELLIPTLDVLRALVEDYGASVVFCTATQPALQDGAGLSAVFGDVEPTEIVPQFSTHFEALKNRVRYEHRPGKISWKDLADEIAGLDENQVLIVLNTRRDALELLDALTKRDVPRLCHLSTLLCSAHRDEVLEDVRQRLAGEQPVYLVSTQVVEAGVDLDFPIAYRAVGPLDRIVQVAGRCNREGKRPKPGRVVIFEPEVQRAPEGPYREGIGLARRFLPEYDLASPETYVKYYRKLYRGKARAGVDLDKYDIQQSRCDLDFTVVAKNYRLIRDDTVSVVVEYGEWENVLDAWTEQPDRAGWQGLQPYLVSVYKNQIDELRRLGGLVELDEELYHWTGKYDLLRGIVPDILHDPADLIVST